MSKPQKLELVSFKVCPFVQRAVIALNEKNVDYSITHLVPGDDQPDWFKAVSPMGKVPVLLVDGTPVFESAVILEYLDEVYEPTLHPADLLEKARQRAWMEFCSELLGKQFQMNTAKDQAGFEAARDAIRQGLQRLAGVLPEAEPFFSGERFALVDCAYAPIFMRLAIVERVFKVDFEMPARVRAWSDALLAKESVQKSVVDNFEEVFMMFIKKMDGYMVNNL